MKTRLGPSAFYSSPRRTPTSGGPKWIVLAVIVALVLGAVVLWRSAAADLFFRITSPLFLAREGAFAGFSTVIAEFQSKVQLQTENEMLRAALATSTAQALDRDALYAENFELKARLGRDAGMQTTLATVVLRPPAIPYDTLLIDAGSSEGVATGDLVSAGGTALIGVVSQVYSHQSRVELFSSPGETFQAFVEDPSGGKPLPLSVEGQGSGSMTAEVPAHSSVAVGDIVAFPTLAGGFVAKISHIDAADNNSFETLYLRLPEDPLSLVQVEVWTKTNAAH